RVVAGAPELLPLAEILVDDISRLHGVQLSDAIVGEARHGDIALKLVSDDAALRSPDSYRVDVDRGAAVEAGSYNAVAFGMMTLLQSMEASAKGLTIPRMRVQDDADRSFRGLQ